MRPKPLLNLLDSVKSQVLYPDEILIVDGSVNDETGALIEQHPFVNLRYYHVPPENRGLTRQRNYGIERVSKNIEIVCFLDDDTVLENDYFEKLINTYELKPDALGVGGYITNESEAEFVGEGYTPTITEYFYDGWKRPDGSRFVLRKKIGLDSNLPPGFMPDFSHGRSVGFLPPSGKIYPVEQLMGGVSSFRKEAFEKISFSEYFEGYGLYEDADFTIRLSKLGQLYCNTAARLAHYHNPDGRPNQYKYGKMVVRNGWYVWRIKNPKPSLKARLKWNSVTLLLTAIRFMNTFTANDRQKAFTESMGRTIGWLSLLFNKPELKK